MASIMLTQGFYATVDEEDLQWLSQWLWFTQSGKYAARYDSNRCLIFMHHAIAERHELVFTPELDHKDQNGFNNQKSNFRAANRTEQMQNRKLRSDNKTGFIGVTIAKGQRKRKYRATITVDRRLIFLGYYLTAEDAARRFDAAAIFYFGEFASLNFPR